MDAFNLLTTSRQLVQGGIGRIPYGEISRFCEDEGITGDMREDVFFLIGQMDHFYVDWQTKYLKKKLDADLKASKGKTAPKGKRR